MFSKQRQDPTVAFPHRLTFYNTPPTSEISLELFQELAIKRLACTFSNLNLVLRAVESAVLRSKTDDDQKKALDEACREHMPLHHAQNPACDAQHERWRDNTSHYILCLAYCRT